MFVLGVIVGILISILIVLCTLYQKTNLDRTVRQIEARFKRKGSIIEPESDELENFVNSLPNETTRILPEE